MKIEEEPLELRKKKGATIMSAKTDRKHLDSLLKEFYQVKKALREKGHSMKHNNHRSLTERKNELLLQIKRELNKGSKVKTERIRKKLWNELGVMV